MILIRLLVKCPRLIEGTSPYYYYYPNKLKPYKFWDCQLGYKKLHFRGHGRLRGEKVETVMRSRDITLIFAVSVKVYKTKTNNFFHGLYSYGNDVVSRAMSKTL